MFWTLIIGLGLAWLIQMVLGWRQMKAFSDNFVAMRKDGRVAMGKFKGALVSGAIVMFVLDDDNRIKYGRRLRGVTVLAGFRDYNKFDGLLMDQIDPQIARPDGRSLMKAVLHAKNNFELVSKGKEAVEAPTPLGRLIAAPGKWRRRAQPSAS